MKLISKYIIIALTLVFSGCSEVEDSNNTNNEEVKTPSSTALAESRTATAKTIEKGKVVYAYKIEGRSEGEIAYYIPTEVEPTSIIILFDAQARGFLPIVRYKALANKYGFILVGSNISENGYPYPQTQEHFTLVKNWIETNFESIKDKVHIGGFSGGARVGGWLAFDFDYPSIFGCAAGVPNNDKEIINNKFFYGTTSTLDFNYRELNALTDGFLALNHFVSIVEGYHDWAPSEEMELIFKWLKMNEMRLGVMDQNIELVTQWFEDYKSNLSEISANNDLPLEIRYNAIIKGSSLFHDLVDISFFEQEKIKFRESKSWAGLSKHRSIANYAEGSWTGKFGYALDGENPVPVWNQYIDELNKEIDNAPNVITKRGLERVNSFISLVGFLKMEDSYNKGNLEEATQFMAIVERVHPTNADVFYFKAIFAAQNNNIQEAKDYLNKAISNGFANYKKLQNQEELSILNINEFVEKIKNPQLN